MKQSFRNLCIGTLAMASTATNASSVSAWDCFGSCCGAKRPPAYPVGPPTPITPSGYGSYYGNYGAYPPSPGTLLPAGVPQTVAGYLPTAAYDTQWNRTPVTYYRPVTQYDPNYGTTVTSLQPCTSYQYQAQRVPLVAPRPMVGDYGYRSNRWPAINAPGYNPTALAYTGSMPQSYPQYQQIPGAGLPFTSSAGSSSTVSSTLPLSTMNYGTAGVAPAVGTQASPVLAANYWGATNPPQPALPQGMANPVVPASSWAPQATMPPMGTGTPVYAAPYSATGMGTPSVMSSPNGVGVGQPSNVPNIPGATVTPLGPPNYSTSPSGSAMASPQATRSPSDFAPPTGYAPAANTPTGGFAPPAVYGSAPNPGETNPVLPPGIKSMNDPESVQPPRLGTPINAPANNPFNDPPVWNNGETVANAFQLKRMPMAAMDPQLKSERNEQSALAATNPSVGSVDSYRPRPVEPPRTLQASPNSPLRSPSDFDARPSWNPKLLDPSQREPEITPESTATIKTVSSRTEVAASQSNEGKSTEGWDSNGIRFVPIRQPK